MKTSLICPGCKKEHEVFWYVLKNGKRELVYRCDRIEYAKQLPVGTDANTEDGKAVGAQSCELRTKNSTIPVPDPENYAGKGLREEWSRGYAKAQQGKQQFQLILMNKK